MKIVQRFSLTLAIVGALMALIGCSGAAPTAITPAGAANGLNTFIYVYSEN